MYTIADTIRFSYDAVLELVTMCLDSVSHMDTELLCQTQTEELRINFPTLASRVQGLMSAQHPIYINARNAKPGQFPRDHLSRALTARIVIQVRSKSISSKQRIIAASLNTDQWGSVAAFQTFDPIT